MKYCSILLAMLLLAACSQEEPASRLPYGAYPIVFTAGICEAEPQSRVSETAEGKSYWEIGDKFKVKIINGDSKMESTCFMNGTGYVDATEPPLYWSSDEEAYVTAWYSNITGQSTVTENTVALADQSSRLAYVLRDTTTADYGSYIGLDFKHQLAKIIVRIEGEGASFVSSVKVRNYTSCTITEGEVSPGTPGLITMHKNGSSFEACVVPVTSIPKGFISLDNGSEANINGITALEAGKVYIVTVNARFPVETVINGHKAVLMRKATAGKRALYFATCNIGADSPEDFGSYFWWGDTVGYPYNSGFSFDEYNDIIVTANKTIDELRSAGYIDDKNNLILGMDAARKLWGGSWRMPTREDIEWLLATDNCDWPDIPDATGGVYVQSKSTGGKIYLPAAGGYYDGNVYSEKRGLYWHSTADINTFAIVGYMALDQPITLNGYPNYGLSVRPVSN